MLLFSVYVYCLPHPVCRLPSAVCRLPEVSSAYCVSFLRYLPRTAFPSHDAQAALRLPFAVPRLPSRVCRLNLASIRLTLSLPRSSSSRRGHCRVAAAARRRRAAFPFHGCAMLREVRSVLSGSPSSSQPRAAMRTRYIEPDLDNCNRKEIGEDNVPPQSHMLACVSDYWSILYTDCY